jgi:REP element-mobilizing transposase RayT
VGGKNSLINYVERYGHSASILITIRTYGTWLHGDERGSVDRFHNKYKTDFAAQNKNREQYMEKKLKSEPVKLDSLQRNSVDIAIREVCDFRNWLLRAINVRTNHVHVVVSNGEPKPDRALNDFKSYGTRKMKANGVRKFEHSPWVDKGCTRYLWNERSIELAVDYVINGQGDDLPDFD